MKTLENIEQEIELETKEMSFNEKQSYKLGIFKVYYDISIEIIRIKNRTITSLEEELEILKDIVKNIKT